MLGRHVAAATGVGVVGGGGGEEYQVPAPLTHTGEEGLAHAQRREHVALVHRGPLLSLPLGDRVDSQGAAGVVDDGVHGAARKRLVGQSLDVVRLLEVCGHPGAAGLGGQGLEPLHPPRGGDNLPAVAAQQPDGGGADAGGGPGDQSTAGRREAVGEVVVVLAHCSTIRPRHAGLAQSAPVRWGPPGSGRTAQPGTPSEGP